ncbi:TonB-dependent receptor, partial [candidate division KSB1 bacterium]|nr:TonB-dependent receptor [candidate division KSB1 bacterium]
NMFFFFKQKTAYEIGYQALLSSKIKATANVFYNRIQQFIVTRTVATFPSPPAPVPGVASKISFLNSGSAEARRAETEVDLWLTDRLKSKLNYSYQWIEDSDTDKWMKGSPEHKLNALLSFDLTRSLSANLRMHRVSRTIYTWDLRGKEFSESVGAYTLVNAWIGYTFPGNQFEVSLSGFNIFDSRHKEHPLGEVLPRKIIAMLKLTL